MIRTCQRLLKARDLKKCTLFQSRSLTDKPDDPDKPYVPPGDEYRYHIRPPDNNVYLKIIFLFFSRKHYVVGAQKNRLDETVLLSTQNTCLN